MPILEIYAKYDIIITRKKLPALRRPNSEESAMRRITLVLVALLALAPITAQAQVSRPPVHSEKWIAEVAQLRFAPWDRKIYEVNAFINANPHKVQYSDDGILYIEEGGSPGLKCINDAQAKMYMLKSLGVESTIVFAQLRKKVPGDQKAIHAYVLVWSGDSTPVGLDNRFRDPVGVKALQAAYEPLGTPSGPVFTMSDVLAREKAKSLTY
jgi:hypothetical protein